VGAPRKIERDLGPQPTTGSSAGRHDTRTGRRRGVHNVTPEEDCRTALLSDSPDLGVRYRTAASEGQRNDPDAKSGLRYSAGRAPRGCGRFILSGLEATTDKARGGARTRTRDRRPSGRRARGRTHQAIRDRARAPGGPRRMLGRQQQNKPNRYPVALEILRRWQRKILRYLAFSPGAYGL
jgi:hypothetical protein